MGIIRPTVEGYLNVLRAATSELSIQRVVHISSIAAAHQHEPFDKTLDTTAITYDDDQFNLQSYEETIGPKKCDIVYAYGQCHFHELRARLKISYRKETSGVRRGSMAPGQSTSI